MPILVPGQMPATRPVKNYPPGRNFEFFGKPGGTGRITGGCFGDMPGQFGYIQQGKNEGPGRQGGYFLPLTREKVKINNIYKKIIEYKRIGKMTPCPPAQKKITKEAQSVLELKTGEKCCIIASLNDRLEMLIDGGYLHAVDFYKSLIEKLQKEWFPEKEEEQNG